MIPESELNTLHHDAGVAVTLALEGEAQGGYEVLLAGQTRAEALARVEPWGSELCDLYRKALGGFCRRHRVREVIADSAPAPRPEAAAR